MRTLCLLLALGALAAAEYVPRSDAGSYAVDVQTGEWIDASRQNRDVPWRLYLPEDAEGPLPVVVFSHGLGGSRDAAEYLGRHLASHGYASFHIQHHGSDTAIWNDGVQAALRNAVSDLQSVINRFQDIPFTVDQITAMNAERPYAGRFDLERLGMSGHSYGAITTLVAAGQSNQRLGQRFAERRFKAAIAFSPSTPMNGTPQEAFADMLMPIFHMTGTKDADPYGRMDPADRQIPFRTIDDVEQCLLVLEDAVHMTFGGRREGYDTLQRHHELVQMASLAFWDAYLRGDQDAKKWLREGGFAAALGEDGTFETKSPR
jgi:predicted dienelactone hydrolase